MMRFLLLLVALVVLAAIVLVATGMINLTQTQSAQAPKYQVDVQEIGIGTTTANVTVPTVGTETKQVDLPTVTVGDGNQANAQ